MMNVIRAAAGVLTAFAVTACYPVTVRTDYDPAAPFAKLHTYQWVDRIEADAGAPGVNNPLVAQRVRNAVDSVLAHRGFRKVSGEAADLQLSFRLVTRETIEQRATYGGYYSYDGFYASGLFGPRFYGRRGFYRRGFLYSPYGYGAVSPYYSSPVERLESTLIIDITDASTGALVWRGWAEKNLDDNPKPNEVQKYVDEAVERMLAQFPPPDFEYTDR